MRAKTTGSVKFTLDPANPPELTPKQRVRLRSLPDSKIDFSGIPQTSGVAWRRPEKLIPFEGKKQITLRLDEDVLKFFKGTGKRYQTRINEVLRLYVDSQQAGRVR